MKLWITIFLMWCLIHFHLGTGLFSGDSLLGNVVLYWRHCIMVINCHYSVNQSFLILNVYCFKSVGSYKHKLSWIESLVILYWGINCSIYKCGLFQMYSLLRMLWQLDKGIGKPIQSFVWCNEIYPPSPRVYISHKGPVANKQIRCKQRHIHLP